MSKHIKKKKKHFTFLTLIMVVSLFGCVELLKGNNLEKFVGYISYVKYRFGIEYVITDNNLYPSIIEAHAVPVLLYHGITKESDRFNITSDTFKEQMYALKTAGYSTLSVNEYVEFQEGKKKVPVKSFLLTFDDGRKDSYIMADPILKALDYTAVMYVASHNSIEKPDGNHNSYYIDPDDIKKMIKSGRWEIGSHAIQDGGGYIPVGVGERATFLSNRKWIESEYRLEEFNEYKNRISLEIAGSKTQLEKEFGIEIKTFSYPFGDYGQQSINNIEALKTIGNLINQSYKVAFRQTWPNDGEYTANYPFDDSSYAKRFETPTSWTGDTLVAFMESVKEKQLPYEDEFVVNNGWKRSWGGITVNNANMYLYSTASTTGAQVILDGTRSLKDYIFTTVLEWIKGSHISLIARQKDSKNYLACTYSDTNIRLEEFLNGKSKIIAEVRHEINMPLEIELGITVEDNFARCLLGRDVVVFGTVSDSTGGIGFKIWDKEINNASVTVKKISVDDISLFKSIKEKLPDYPKK